MFSIFRSSYSIVDSNLLQDAIDVHCHILPGVDDGMDTYKNAITALRWLKSIGLRSVCLTPHIMSDFYHNTPENLTNKFNLFLKKIENENITDVPDLKLAAEYMLELAFYKHKESQLLTFANQHVLVETSYITPPIGLFNLFTELRGSGYVPVLAHPERNQYMDRKDYDLLKNRGVKFQLNLLSLIGRYGETAKEKACQLLMDGLYDFAGSDFHQLEYHKKAFEVERLTKKQIKKLHGLFKNNGELW